MFLKCFYIILLALALLLCSLAHAAPFRPACGVEAYESLIMEYIVKYGGTCWPLDDASITTGALAGVARELTGVYPGSISGTTYYNQVTVSGTLSPDATGTYTVRGMYNNYPYYSLGTSYYLWHSDTWYITVVKGVTSPGYWHKSGAAVILPGNDYLAGETYTGTATVANVTASGIYLFVPSGVTFQSAGPIVSGEQAKAAAFDGAAGKVTRAWNSTFDGAAVSVAAWVKVSGGAGTGRAIMSFRKQDAPKGGWALLVNASNVFCFYAFNTAQTLIASSTVAYTLNEWTHVCGVWDGTNLHLYVNGAEITPAVAMTGHPVNPSVNLTFGATVATQYFNGSLAYPTIFGGTALTATDALTLYNAAVKGL